MSNPTTHAANGTPIPVKDQTIAWAKTLAAPYYIAVAAVLGLLTAGFLAVIGLLILVAANFNLLGFVE